MASDSENERAYYEGLAAEISVELDWFEEYIVPIFLSRGLSRTDALNYYSNRQLEEALDTVASILEEHPDSSDDEPWKRN